MSFYFLFCSSFSCNFLPFISCFLYCCVVLYSFACCLAVCSLQSCSTSLRLPACWFPRQSANQTWCGESFINTSLLHAPSLWLHYSLLWPSPHSSAWFGHRLGLFSRPSTSGGVVLSHCLEWFQDCSPLCTPWTCASINICFTHSAFGFLPADLDTNYMQRLRCFRGRTHTHYCTQISAHKEHGNFY